MKTDCCDVGVLISTRLCSCSTLRWKMESRFSQRRADVGSAQSGDDVALTTSDRVATLGLDLSLQ